MASKAPSGQRTETTVAPPAGDPGGDTFWRFRYQAEVTLPFCFVAACGSEGLVAVVPEYHEDVALEYADSWRFLQIKSRDADRGAWTLAQLLAKKGGALRSLYRTHLATLGRNDPLELILEGGLKSGDPIHRLRSEDRSQLVAPLARGLKCTEAEAQAFLKRLVLNPTPPSRRDIRASNHRLLHKHAPHLTMAQLDAVHDAWLRAIDGAMAAERLGAFWPRAVIHPERRTPLEEERLEAKRLTAGLLRSLAPLLSSSVEALYRASLKRTHNQAPSLFSSEIADLSSVYVELQIGELDGAPGERPGKGRDLALGELLELSTGRGHAPRWVVRGDPGSGKSTAARHLVWELAGRDQGLLPVYAPLPALAAAECRPFDFAESQLTSEVGSAGEGLARFLDDRAQRPVAPEPRVCLLLDGLDEVPSSQIGWVRHNLSAWAQALPQVTIAVFSRPVGYKQPGPAYTHHARIQPLSRGKKKQLLAKWLPDEEHADEVCRRLDDQAGLRDACGVPLLLSLLAYLVKRGPDGGFPLNRLELFRRGIRVLLERGQNEAEDQGVSDVEQAYDVLSRLGLELQGSADAGWRESELKATLEAIRQQPGSETVSIGKDHTWSTPKAFLDDVSKRSGVLADYSTRARGPGASEEASWRFLHRQFRELFAAESLHRQSDDPIVKKARQLTSEEVPGWAEVLGFACEMAGEPLRILRSLAEVSEDLALRVLPEVDGVDPVLALDTLKGGGKWDGDFLVHLLDRWTGDGRLSREDARGWLWRQVRPERSVLELAYFHFALHHLDGEVEHPRFFAVRPHWGEAAPEEPEWVALDGGVFLMGSPEDEAERSPDETQRQVELPPFELAATAVTNGEYEVFDPDHEARDFGGRVAPAELPRHPVLNVSWWEAYLYSRWRRSRLPGEAEWEYACRAGTRTPFSFGEVISTDQVNYDGNFPYGKGKKGEYRQATVPVACLPPNEWGLFEMHGNVWEWCRDTYDEAARRVFRGGSRFSVARYVRSAYRNWYAPGDRSDYLGLRLARGQGGAGAEPLGRPNAPGPPAEGRGE